MTVLLANLYGMHEIGIRITLKNVSNVLSVGLGVLAIMLVLQPKLASVLRRLI